MHTKHFWKDYFLEHLRMIKDVFCYFFVAKCQFDDQLSNKLVQTSKVKQKKLCARFIFFSSD